MNLGRVAAAAVVAWVVSIGIGYLVNQVLFAGLMQANVTAFRPETEMMGNLPLGFGALLLGFFAFAYAYAKGYEGGNGVMEGIRFGVVASFIVNGFGVIWFYVTVPITGSLAVAMVIDTVVELAIYGAIVGAIYKPAGTMTRAAAV